jgi:hypothetical protein
VVISVGDAVFTQADRIMLSTIKETIIVDQRNFFILSPLIFLNLIFLLS